MPDVLIDERDGPVATLTLNRPERLNAVTPGMIDALDTALARANTDPAVRVIRLRGPAVRSAPATPSPTRPG